MNTNNMTKKDFQELPEIETNSFNDKFTSIVILPTNYVHDSGFKCMDYILVGRNSEPIGKISHGSDVLHINGIGGYGKNIENMGSRIKPISWGIDCLKKSKLLRLFCDRDLEIDSWSGSSFSVYAVKE